MKYLMTFEKHSISGSNSLNVYKESRENYFPEPRTREDKMDFILSLYGKNPRIADNLPIGGIESLRDLTDEQFEDFYQSIKPSDFRIGDFDNEIDHFHKSLYNSGDHIDNVYMRQKYGSQKYPDPRDIEDDGDRF